MKKPPVSVLTAAVSIALCCAALVACKKGEVPQSGLAEHPFPEANLIARDELDLAFTYGEGVRRLAFATFPGSKEEWRDRVKAKLGELLGLRPVLPGEVTELRRWEHRDVIIHALVMRIDGSLSLPAYWLVPNREDPEKMARAHIRFAEKYGVDGIMLDIDTALLADAIGVPVAFPEDEPARAKGALVESYDQLKDLEPRSGLPHKVEQIPEKHPSASG